MAYRSAGQRISRLELRLANVERCPTCRRRSAVVVVGEGERQRDTSACPSCGWEPLQIKVIYVQVPLPSVVAIPMEQE